VRWALVVLGLVGTPLALEWLLHAMLFHPSRLEAAEIRALGEPVSYLAADGTRLTSWWVPARSPSRRTIVMFHGNADTASRLSSWAAPLSADGADVLLAEYRGYGRSDGEPSARGIEIDAAAAIRYVVEERGVPLSHVIVFGQSLGGAAAISALAGPARDAAGGVVASTFTSLHDMCSHVIGFPLSRLVFDAYGLDNLERARAVRAPMLQLHGDADQVVPFALGERLRDVLHPVRFLRIPGGQHNLPGDVQMDALASFAREVVP
jgi:uncharacterized protein